MRCDPDLDRRPTWNCPTARGGILCQTFHGAPHHGDKFGDPGKHRKHGRCAPPYLGTQTTRRRLGPGGRNLQICISTWHFQSTWITQMRVSHGLTGFNFWIFLAIGLHPLETPDAFAHLYQEVCTGRCRGTASWGGTLFHFSEDAQTVLKTCLEGSERKEKNRGDILGGRPMF